MTLLGPQEHSYKYVSDIKVVIQHAHQQSRSGIMDMRGKDSCGLHTFIAICLTMGRCIVQVLSPTFKTTAQGNYYVERPGTVFIEFADAVQGTGSAPGERRYDWGNKQVTHGSAH